MSKRGPAVYYAGLALYEMSWLYMRGISFVLRHVCSPFAPLQSEVVYVHPVNLPL